MIMDFIKNIKKKEGIIMMGKIFNAETPFWQAMERIFDIFILNSLWLLCCLPVFTAGPSTTAFYYAMLNMVRGEDTSVSKDFFHSFKQNFKQGLFLGIPLTAIGIFLFVDIRMCYHSGTGIFTFFMVFFAVIFLFWAFITLYSFPLLAKFEKKNLEIVVWAFMLSIKHILRTLLMLLIIAFGIWVCHIMPGLIFIVPGLVVEFHAVIMAAILKSYLPDVHIAEELKPLSFISEDMDMGVKDYEKE